MGVGEWFAKLAENLKVQNGDVISYRYKRITKALNVWFRGTESEDANSFYTGSYGRNTAINGASDVDMIYQLPADLYAKYSAHRGNGQSALLQAVRSAILATYSATSIRGDGQVVVVKFDDGIAFEVVPAFLNTDNKYTFPDANDNGRWRETDPKPEIAAIKTRNDAKNNNLVHLCRMLRAWKANCNVTMGGLLVDTLAYQFIENWYTTNRSFFWHDYMARDFFEFAKGQDKTKTYWRAPGSGQSVWGGEFQYKATVAYNLSLAAIEHQTKGHEWAACDKWRDIFGTNFPSG